MDSPIKAIIHTINGKIDPLSESDDFDEEVIYSQESPKMEEFFRDFDWDLDRFVEYRSPLSNLVKSIGASSSVSRFTSGSRACSIRNGQVGAKKSFLLLVP